MTNEIVIRDARPDESRFAAEMTRLMVLDMEHYGGNAAATSKTAWEKTAESIADELKQDDCKYLIAETTTGDRVGLAAANLVTLGGAFEPKKTLHLGILYVLPSCRKAGIGGRLIGRAMDWGRAAGAEYCTLNVLAENPARFLYSKLGFSQLDIVMKRPL